MTPADRARLAGDLATFLASLTLALAPRIAALGGYNV